MDSPLTSPIFNIIANFVFLKICRFLLYFQQLTSVNVALKNQRVVWGLYIKLFLDWFNFNGTAKTKLAMLALLQWREFVKNSSGTQTRSCVSLTWEKAEYKCCSLIFSVTSSLLPSFRQSTNHTWRPSSNQQEVSRASILSLEIHMKKSNRTYKKNSQVMTQS